VRERGKYEEKSIFCSYSCCVQGREWEELRDERRDDARGDVVDETVLEGLQ